MPQPPEMSSGGLGFSFSMGAPPRIKLPPLRLVVMGDFSGVGDAALGPVQVTADELAQVFVGLSRELTLEVEDLLSAADKPKTAFVKVPVASLDDLEPAAVLEHLPLLAPLRELVLALEQGKGKGAAAIERAVQGCRGVPSLGTMCDRVLHELGGAVERRAPAPAPAPAASKPVPAGDDKDDALDRILGMVDMGASPAASPPADTAKSAVSALISGVLGAGAGQKPGGAAGAPATGALGSCLEQARALLGAQLWAVLHHPEFQRMEATWRGLKFLVHKCNFRKGMRLDLLDVRREDAVEAFANHVHGPEMAGTSAVTPALVVVDFSLGTSQAQLEQLQALAELAEEAQVPVLGSVELGFFGLESRDAINSMRLVSGLLDEPQYTGFRALRDKDCSRWLALASGRFLLREPYRAESRGAAGLAEPVAPDGRDLLWGAPTWLVAGLVTSSQAEVGWPTEITGMQSGVVEDLPIHPFPGPGGRQMHIPLEAFVSNSLGDDLARQGFLAFTCAPDGDAAYLLRAPVLHPPGRFTEQGATDNARQMATLGYQLLVSRLADLLGRHKAGLVSGKGEAEIQAALQGFFLSLVGDSGPGAGASVRLGQGGGRLLAEIAIRMGRDVMNGAAVNFTIPV